MQSLLKLPILDFSHRSETEVILKIVADTLNFSSRRIYRSESNSGHLKFEIKPNLKSKSNFEIKNFSDVSRESNYLIRKRSLLYIFQLLFRKRGIMFNDNSFPFFMDTFQNVNSISGKNYYYSSYSEDEEVSFSIDGSVHTSDGRDISFNINALFSRSFCEEIISEEDINSSLQESNLVDPLIINLNNNLAEISNQTFYFDIDSDGIKDEMYSLKSGSGFLALDSNSDGIINDGSELFGTKTQNGFSELSLYDEDNNGWIDDGDSVFSKLLVWTKDENGNDILFKAKELGIGAICLNSYSVPFSYKSSSDNSLQAVNRYAGAFLYENGDSGIIQQTDFNVL